MTYTTPEIDYDDHAIGDDGDPCGCYSGDSAFATRYDQQHRDCDGCDEPGCCRWDDVSEQWLDELCWSESCPGRCWGDDPEEPA